MTEKIPHNTVSPLEADEFLKKHDLHRDFSRLRRVVRSKYLALLAIALIETGACSDRKVEAIQQNVASETLVASEEVNDNSSLWREYPDAGPERDAYIIAQIKQGNFENIEDLTILDVSTAELLAASGEKILRLNRVKSPEVAPIKALVAFKGDYIFLEGIEKPEAALIKEMTAFQGKWIYLNPKNLDTAAVKAYVALRNAIVTDDRIDWIEAMLNNSLHLEFEKGFDFDVEKAEAAGAFQGENLSLGFTSIDAATAKELAAFQGENLSLGFTSIDAATAKELAAFQGSYFSLNGLTSIDAATAKELAAFGGDSLLLNGLTSIRADIAEESAVFQESHFFLDGLESIDAATAKELAAFQGENLSLGFTSIDAAIAKELATCRGDPLFFAEAAIAKELAAFGGDYLSLGLTSIGAAIAKELAAFGGDSLLLNDLISIKADVAEKLAAFKGSHLSLSSLDEKSKAKLRYEQRKIKKNKNHS